MVSPGNIMIFKKIPPELSKELGRYLEAGTQFGLSIIIGFFGGWWLDGKTGTSPLFIILGVFLGAGAGFYHLYRLLLAHEKRKHME